MTTDKFEENLKKNKAYLDKIDFTVFLERSETLKDLIHDVESIYDVCDYSNNPFLCGSIFCHMSDYDIRKYLEERYGNEYEFKEAEYYEPPVYIRKVTK